MRRESCSLIHAYGRLDDIREITQNDEERNNDNNLVQANYTETARSFKTIYALARDEKSDDCGPDGCPDETICGPDGCPGDDNNDDTLDQLMSFVEKTANNATTPAIELRIDIAEPGDEFAEGLVYAAAALWMTPPDQDLSFAFRFSFEINGLLLKAFDSEKGSFKEAGAYVRSKAQTERTPDGATQEKQLRIMNY